MPVLELHLIDFISYRILCLSVYYNSIGVVVGLSYIEAANNMSMQDQMKTSTYQKTVTLSYINCATVSLIIQISVLSILF